MRVCYLLGREDAIHMSTAITPIVLSCAVLVLVVLVVMVTQAVQVFLPLSSVLLILSLLPLSSSLTSH
jgi:hypothetical protein